jgi:hypothetical protein
VAVRWFGAGWESRRVIGLRRRIRECGDRYAPVSEARGAARCLRVMIQVPTP